MHIGTLCKKCNEISQRFQSVHAGYFLNTIKGLKTVGKETNLRRLINPVLYKRLCERAQRKPLVKIT